MRRFLPALVSSPLAKLTFVGSRDKKKAKQYAEEFGAQKFGSYEDVLASKEVDAVYISTPPLLHAEWVKKAASAGKHIICEKPSFPDYETTSGIISFCRGASVRLFENYAFLYHPQHKAARELSSRVGQVSSIEAVFLYPNPPGGDIRWRPELGGGVFHDSFGYPIATALHYFGELPESVECTLTVDQLHQIDTAAKLGLSWGDGRQAAGRIAMGEEGYSSRYILRGQDGQVEVCRAFAVDSDKPTEIAFETGDKKEIIQVKPASQFQLALEDFCKTIVGEVRRLFEDDILARAAVKEAALRSARAGKPGFLSEIGFRKK